MRSLKKQIRRLMRAWGFDVVRLPRYLLLMQLGGEPPDQAVGADPLERFLFERRLADVLQRLRVNCVLDVGANEGQYGLTLRRIGYTGYIVSFEPVPEVFRTLQTVSKHDAKWTVHQLALGPETTRARIHVTAGTDFSSFLKPTAYAVERFRASASVEHVEQVEVRRLDDVLGSVIAHVDDPRLFLKMDTQGYDLQVFAGAGHEINRMLGLQAEVAAVPLYDGTRTMLAALRIYQSYGFELSGLFPVCHDPATARVLEYDCLMLRSGDGAGSVQPAFTPGDPGATPPL
jgi:FkbM family methyltransferase